jgi:GH18 family chitinase
MKLARTDVLGALLIVNSVLSPGACAVAAAPHQEEGRGPPPFCVVGYLPDYRLASFDPEQAKFLTDLIYFSAEPELAGELNQKGLRPDAAKALQQIKDRHKVRLLLCVGGWGHSAGFAGLAASPRAQQRFAAALTEFCADNHFDGADLDWEHPANEAEQKNYAALLAEVRKAFRPRRLLLTVALAGWQELPADGVAAVDRVHLMAYDARGRHATPEFAAADVGRLIAKGVPAAKVCLGLPFYGRGVEDGSRTLTYAEVVRKYRPAADVNEVDGVYFNGVRTVERKTRHALEHKLAGVMVWELGQDAPGQDSLLRAIHRVATASRPGR